MPSSCPINAHFVLFHIQVSLVSIFPECCIYFIKNHLFNCCVSLAPPTPAWASHTLRDEALVYTQKLRAGLVGNLQQSSWDETWLSSWASPGCKVPCATWLPCCLGSSDQGFNLVTGLLGPSESPGVSLISYTVEHTDIILQARRDAGKRCLTWNPGSKAGAH